LGHPKAYRYGSNHLWVIPDKLKAQEAFNSSLECLLEIIQRTEGPPFNAYQRIARPERGIFRRAAVDHFDNRKSHAILTRDANHGGANNNAERSLLKVAGEQPTHSVARHR